MLIYVNGDSFVEGTGLADHIMFKYSARLSSKDWITHRAKLMRDLETYHSLRSANQKLAWPACLENISGGEVINGALGGSSIHGIANRTITDLEALVASGKHPDYVFIGLTGIDRVMILNQTPTKETWWTLSAIPNYVSRLDKPKEKYVNTFWETHSDEELLILFLRECLLIKSYVNSKTGKDPIFLNTAGSWDNLIPLVKNTKFQLIPFLWNLLGFDDLFEEQVPFGNFGKEYPMCLDTHWSHLAHIDYAQYIFETFINEPK